MYWLLFFVLVAVLGAVQYKTHESSALNTSPQFKAFQRNYLVVYVIMMGADWMQGPYVYALYDNYGYSMAEIGYLFIAGFGSSMVLGTFAGGIADKYGRKRMSIAFGVIYSLSCLTKFVNNYSILMIGRLLGGMATSLLMSVFESWMVHEHKRFGYPDEWLSQTFAHGTLWGQGIIAIVAGLLASWVTDLSGSYVAPFASSMVFLICGTVVVYLTWSENFGDQQVQVQETFSRAWTAMINDRTILMVGMVQSLFEGAMYTFVFMWTPALQEGQEEGIPHGVIFATYMVCIMLGSSLFSQLTRRKYPVELIGKVTLVVAGIALFVPALVSSHGLILLAFLVFEVCCGVYFPMQGTQRGIYIPGQYRSAIMNFFRIPLNLLVLVVLIKAGDWSQATVFTLCAVWLGVGAFFQFRVAAVGTSQSNVLPVQEVIQEAPPGTQATTKLGTTVALPRQNSRGEVQAQWDDQDLGVADGESK